MKLAILHQLDNDDLNFADCRSQCYDNANVMSGDKGSLQRLMRNENALAFYSNCDNHSLNLVGIDAVNADVLMTGFFGTVDSIYNFFGRSTLRWEKLKAATRMTLKSQSETRWSSRAEAIKPLNVEIKNIVQLLETMSDNEEENALTRADAYNINIRLHSYDFLFLLGYWDRILSKIDRVQKRLQAPSMTFKDASLDVSGLKQNFQDNREIIVNTCMDIGTQLCQDFDVPVERRIRRVRSSENCSFSLLY